MTRFNSTTGLLEYYNGTTWLNAGTTYAISALVVAGGGGGGATYGGGGGAGGLLSISTNLSVGTSYTVTIGAGGAGSVNTGGVGSNGGYSLFGSYYAPSSRQKHVKNYLHQTE
jgi:hypothetical protein